MKMRTKINLSAKRLKEVEFKFSCFFSFPLDFPCKAWYTMRIKSLLQNFQKGPNVRMSVSLCVPHGARADGVSRVNVSFPTG